MITLRDPVEMVAWRRQAREKGATIGFVPTMGYLHDGHLSLMDIARPLCDLLVVSIYVNPLQFGPGEDLDRYPSDPEGDARKCMEHRVDALFMPQDLYPPGFCTRVHVDRLTHHLCGASRPGHFTGVATVVARLFGLVGADIAVFGEKDWQQLVVVRRMVEDLAIPVRILSGPTVREPDGLAMSSRNRYLSPEERVRATSLYRCLRAMQTSQEANVARLKKAAMPLLDVDHLDYLEVVGADDLVPLATVDRPARALVAARIGSTRLIDNVALGAR